MRKRINVPAPTKKEVADAAAQLAKGHPSGGKVEDERKTAKKNNRKRTRGK